MSKRAASDTLRDAVARTRPAPRPAAAPAPARGPDDGPDLFWDILDFHVSPHLPLPDLVSLGETAWRLANVWRLHVKELPQAVLKRSGRGRLRHFPNLERLHVHEAGLDEDIALLPRLTMLNMGGHSLVNPAATLANLPRLTQLSFANTNATADDLRGLSAVRELEFAHNRAPVTVDMFQHMPALVALVIRGHDMDEDAFVHCSGLEFLAIQTRLDLSAILAPLTNLTGLYADECPNMTDAALASLRGLRFLALGKENMLLTSDVLRPLIALEVLFWEGNETLAGMAVEKHTGEHLHTVLVCASTAANSLRPVFIRQVRRLGISFFDFIDAGAHRPLPPMAYFNDVNPNPRIGPADSDDESSFSSFEDDSVDLMDL